MTELDMEGLQKLRSKSRNRKLTLHDRAAIVALHRKEIPSRLIARAFGVGPNAVYYVVNWPDTVAYKATMELIDQMGPERVWNELVKPEHINAINEGITLLLAGKKLNDGRRRNPSPRTRRGRARTALEVPQATGDEAGGSPAAY